MDQTLKFAKRLDARGNKVWIRFVLVPGLKDNPKNIEGLVGFVGELGNVERLEILPFQKMGEKNTRVPDSPTSWAPHPNRR